MRKFSLINERNQEYPLNGENGVYFFNPEGLGYAMNTETASTGNGFFKLTTKKESQSAVSGTMIFMPVSRSHEGIVHNLNGSYKKISTIVTRATWQTSPSDTADRVFHKVARPSMYPYYYDNILNKPGYITGVLNYTGSNIKHYVSNIYLKDVSSNYRMPEGTVYCAELYDEAEYERSGTLVTGVSPTGCPPQIALIFTQSVPASKVAGGGIFNISAGVYLPKYRYVTLEGTTQIYTCVSGFVMKSIDTISPIRNFTAYDSYSEFISFVESSEKLILSYNPNGTEYSETYYADVSVTRVEKSELAQEDSLCIEIEFSRLSMWYTVVEATVLDYMAKDAIFTTSVDPYASKVCFDLYMTDVSFTGPLSIKAVDAETEVVLYTSTLSFDSKLHTFPSVYYSGKIGEKEIRIVSTQIQQGRGTEFDGVRYSDLTSDVFIEIPDGRSIKLVVDTSMNPDKEYLSERVILKVYRYYRSV